VAGRPRVSHFLLRSRDAVDVTPPGLPSQKTARVVWGVYVLLAPPVWGRGTPGVVVGVAQNGTVGCEKVHSRRVTTNLGES
jgi:hypothetical protein